MILSLLLLACSGGATVTGTVTDAVFAQPLGGFEIVATARDTSGGPSCTTAVAPVAADGSFTLTLCAGTYDVRPTGDIFLPAFTEVADTTASPLAVQAFRAPTGNGVYLLGPGGFELLSTTTGLMRDELPGGEPIVYPTKRLASPPKVTDQTVLLLVGDEAERLPVPLVAHSEPITLKDGTLPPAEVAGLRVGAAVEPVVAALDASQTVEASSGDRKLRVIKPGGLPAGRYALFGERDNRAVVVEF